MEAIVGDEAKEGVSHLSDPLLDQLKEIARSDDEYLALVTTIADGFPERRDYTPSCVRQFWSLRWDLSVEDGLAIYNGQIVVPRAARRDIRNKLHASHQGITRTKRRARQAVYWPGMTNEIVLLVEGCGLCQENRASNPKEPLCVEPPPERVFEDVSADLFESGSLRVLVTAGSSSTAGTTILLPK